MVSAQWSLLGIDEYAAMAKFRAQVPLTVSQLAQLYARKFGWSQADSQAAAETSVAAAIDRGFGFSNAPMFGDRSQAVRQAILEHKSVAELQALHWTAVAPKADAFQWNESVLSIAVNHPDALRWLIAKKLDPNHANAFGKTPLMYAAQHSSLEAVRILLAAGADPNAATIFPEDTCFYTLSRANVSVLHYAARYGSAAILEALVAAGALTSVTTEQRDETPGQTPLEWLRSSTSNNIAESDRARLEQLLAPQTSEKLAEYSQQQALQAEKQYAAGDLNAALRTLKQALQANPSNQRALSNLSLLSLRAGQYGESLEAATRLIAESKDAGLIANAWFNIGLACERSDRSSFSTTARAIACRAAFFLSCNPGGQRTHVRAPRSWSNCSRRRDESAASYCSRTRPSIAMSSFEAPTGTTPGARTYSASMYCTQPAAPCPQSKSTGA